MSGTTDGMQGTKADRAAFLQMFAHAGLKHFDIVMFWALDRLGGAWWAARRRYAASASR